jgi:hypothetical protein
MAVLVGRCVIVNTVAIIAVAPAPTAVSGASADGIQTVHGDGNCDAAVDRLDVRRFISA